MSRSRSSTGTRAATALTTRRRMVGAAYRCFGAGGYRGTTMTAIAHEAGVAVQTLYYTFHTKAALLGEAIGAAVLGFDRWREPPADPPTEELLVWLDWWETFAAAPNSAEALDVFVSAGVPILDRIAPLVPAMHATAGDPEGEEIVGVAERHRYESYREVVRVLAEKPDGLRASLGQDTATDMLYALFSAEVYRALSGRRWSLERCREFFRQFLERNLIGS
ncbi:MAG: TetR/AcrR family transcriptional regulator [Actinomycetota bacterium]